MKKSLKAGLLALALLVSFEAQAQSNIAPSNEPIVSAGRSFHCILMADLSPSLGDGLASCRLKQPLLADDRTTVAVQAGSWLNGKFDGQGTVLWQAVQTGDQAGSLVYARPDTMVSTTRGKTSAGDELLVTFQRDVSFPKPDPEKN